MFEGIGVGLTVRELGVDARLAATGRRGARLSEVLPVVAWSDAEKAYELGRIQQTRAILDAYEAAVVVEFAADRPESRDLPSGASGAGVNVRSPIPGTSEFFVDELAVVTNSSTRVAARLAEQSWVLVERLPAVWAALADGELDTRRARVFIDVLGATAAGVPEAVVPGVLPEAAGLSLGRLRARLQKAVLAVDEEFAEQVRAAAEAQADVRVYPTAPGMSELATELPSPVAAACWSQIDELAWMRKNDGDPRPIGALRALTHAELILRPWDDSRPAVTAVLQVVAPLPSLTPPGPSAHGAAAQEPAEVNGTPITAAHVRELLVQLDGVCPGGVQAPAGGSLQIAVTDADGALLATTSRPELERIARRGCPEHPDDPDRNAVRGASCGCAVLDRPPPVDRYRPTPAQYRFGKIRDRTCRQPGCSQPVARADLDHVIAHADGGQTDCDNLCCLCRRHHRLKTHAPGWRFVLLPGGVLRVTTPCITRTTRPPGLHDRIEQRALPAPPPPPAPPEEPPPF